MSRLFLFFRPSRLPLQAHELAADTVSNLAADETNREALAGALPGLSWESTEEARVTPCPGRLTMPGFATLRLPADPTVQAPDGSDVRVLLSRPGGSMAHFELAAGHVARAVAHRTVEEIWYVTAGRGEMWRSLDGSEEVVALEPGLCLTIPRGTHFQFRAAADSSVSAVAITMPPWPGPDEAYFVEGPWAASA